MLETVLSESEREILRLERHVLRELQALVDRSDDSQRVRKTIEDALRSLDELFLLVVVGEFNSGKSTFINALLGLPILEEGVTPTTARIHRLIYGEESARRTDAQGIEVVAEPVDLLRQIHLVDTPGTNALDREHEALTQQFIPTADLVLFVTSADRPFTESERAFLEDIREWGKKLVIVINKMDFLASDDDRWKVAEFVRTNAEQLLGVEPELYSVSSKKALDGKLNDDPLLAADSKFYDLERYVTQVLDEKERLKLKLSNPIGIGRRVTDETLETVTEQLTLLAEDVKALESIDAQLTLYQEDLRSSFRFRLADVDNELHGFEKRGIEFFDDTLRISRAMDLMNKERIRGEFERKVIEETPSRLDAKVQEIIDWMVAAELEQWQDVSTRIERRRQSHSDRGADEHIGELGRFEYNRSELLKTVGKSARDSIDRFDQRDEAKRLADSVHNAIAGTAIVEASAVGLGTIFTVLATTQVADLTGILAASAIAIVGFFILPARRRKAKTELKNKIITLRNQLMDGLTDQFDREVERSSNRIQESIAPYTRFVRGEGNTLRDLEIGLGRIATELAEIESAIQAL